MWHVYRFFGEQNRLLYVGCSKNPKARIQDHKRSAEWFAEVRRTDISPPLSERDAAAIEGAAIANDSPAYNVNGRKVPSNAEAYRKRLNEYRERAERARRLRDIAGESWTTIGQILGVSRQRAQQLAAKARAASKTDGSGYEARRAGEKSAA